MKLEYYEDTLKGEYVYEFRIPMYELANISFDKLDSQVIEMSKNHSTIADKLLALEIIARRAQEQFPTKEEGNGQI